MIALIAAYAEHRIIGRDGRIPWNIPGEQHRFRDLTMGHTIVMGRKTYEEIGYPLPGRETIVLSRTRVFDAPHCTTVLTLAQALMRAEGDDIYIAGGAQLYREALPLADVLYLTEIHQAFDGDTYFPVFDETVFERTACEDIDGCIPYTYLTYHRKERA